MKKILIFLSILVIISIVVVINFSAKKTQYNQIMKENAEYEQYKEKEIYGLDIATIINKTIDKNAKNKIENDENNSIEIEIYMLDNETTYKMETIYNAGIEQFVQYYGNIKFKCSKIEYNGGTGKVKYILFEQLPTS